jgi:hypothetical protein
MSVAPLTSARPRGFKGWVVALWRPVVLWVGAFALASASACILTDIPVAIGSTVYGGLSGALVIVVAAPVAFVFFLLLAAMICWLVARAEPPVPPPDRTNGSSQ